MHSSHSAGSKVGVLENYKMRQKKPNIYPFSSTSVLCLSNMTMWTTGPGGTYFVNWHKRHRFNPKPILEMPTVSMGSSKESLGGTKSVDLMALTALDVSKNWNKWNCCK